MQRRYRLLFALPAVAGCHAPMHQTAETPPGAKAPLFREMGAHHRPVRTDSTLAQRYFDQGLVWSCAFNHDEAIRSFQQAADLDPDCAMAWWGIALCNGPHINNPVVPPDRAAAAWSALQRAMQCRERAAPVERDLIEALSHRYADPAPADRRPLDEAYASAMRAVWKKHPTDADVGTLCAEALMDLQPWDLWTADGRPKGNAEEILATLEAVLKLDEQHPGANHLYIHAVEASPFPEKGIASADRLRNAVPISGHLVHMPSHIDVQVGQWALASDQNVRAVEADQRYRAVSPRQGFYRVYMAHDNHFLMFAAMMEGRYATALKAARAVIDGIPEDYARSNAAIVDGFMASVMDVHKRFGKWDEVLAERKPDDCFPISNAYWHYARGLAHAAKGEIEPARKEQAAFVAARARVPADAMISINKAHQTLDIAAKMLDGEIAFREGRIDDAVAALRAGVTIEDGLLYTEPPDWIQPVRHTLAAVLLHADRVPEAEAVYRADLDHWPENGWSLHGLASCLRQRGATEEAARVEARFNKTWARADTQIGASCLCVPGGKPVTGNACGM